MNQAIVSNITKSSPLSATARMVGASAIDDRPTILIPVRDDRFAPALRCGEFAIVDTSVTYPEDGALVYFRGSKGNYLNIIQLRACPADHPVYARPSRQHPAPFWTILLGRFRVGNWTPQCQDWAPGGYASMSDGQLSEKYVEEGIVGRVIGVLGDSARAVNWKGL